PIVGGEKLRLLPQFRQLALDAVQVVIHVLALVGRLDRAAVIEDHPVDFEHLFVVLDLLRMLEKRADHPGVGQDGIEPFHCFLGRHGRASGFVDTAATAAGFAEDLPDSASSLENNTSAAPAPTRMMPSHIFQPGRSTAKWKGWPGFGCQSELTTVLMIGARPKISGAM